MAKQYLYTASERPYVVTIVELDDYPDWAQEIYHIMTDDLLIAHGIEHVLVRRQNGHMFYAIQDSLIEAP